MRVRNNTRVVALAAAAASLTVMATLAQAHRGQAGHGEGHDDGATYAERHMMTEHHIDSWVVLFSLR